MMWTGGLRACEGGKRVKNALCISERARRKKKNSPHLCQFHCADLLTYERVLCGNERDGVQLLPLSPPLNGLLMESNEGALSRQMCPPCNCVLPRDGKTDPSETLAGKAAAPCRSDVSSACVAATRTVRSQSSPLTPPCPRK